MRCFVGNFKVPWNIFWENYSEVMAVKADYSPVTWGQPSEVLLRQYTEALEIFFQDPSKDVILQSRAKPPCI